MSFLGPGSVAQRRFTGLGHECTAVLRKDDERRIECRVRGLICIATQGYTLSSCAGTCCESPLRLLKTSVSHSPTQKGLEVCYCLWGYHPDPRLGPILGPSRSHPKSEGVPSRFAMCFVLQRFGPIQVPRWGPSRPVLVPSCSRAFLPGSGLDGPKQTSWPLPTDTWISGQNTISRALFRNRESENSRRLWLSEIPCWKGFPANFDAAGK